jgi:hypothetical protein
MIGSFFVVSSRDYFSAISNNLRKKGNRIVNQEPKGRNSKDKEDS